MSNNTVKQLAATVKIPVEQLLDKLNQAGITVNDPDQPLSNLEKQQFLNYLRQKKPSGLQSINPVSASKKSEHSTLKLKGSAGSVTITRTRKKDFMLESQDAASEDTETSKQQTTSAYPVEKDVLLVEQAKQEKTDKVDLEPRIKILGRIDPALIRRIPSVTPTVSKKKGVDSPKMIAHKDDKKPKSSLKEKSYKHHRRTGRGFLEEDAQQEEKIENRRKKSKIFKETSLKQDFEKPVAPMVHEIFIPERLTVSELAQKMSVKAAAVIKHLMKLGVRAMINQPIEQDIAAILVEEMGHIPKIVESDALETHLQVSTKERRGEETTRPPIVTVMGHVDHGKTSLLDYIRRTKVASGEAGGITQHIGAYHVELPNGMVTFLDTPGHAAFTAMRARGARLTDIVALIVAADDGVMPQTVEAIQHAQAANVPIVVVMNKIDKPDSNIERIQQELAKYQLVPESWGGDTLFVPVSAKTGQGIDELLDALLVQAEMLELTASVTGPAQGIIIESRMEKGRGPVASILVQRGTLRKGDILLAGTTFGRVKALHDENGKTILSAGPSMPVEILGLTSPAIAGDEALVVDTERKAREISLLRAVRARDAHLKSQSALKAQYLMHQLDDTSIQKSLNVILKADVQGSVEAIREALMKLSTPEVEIKLLATGVGGITESDVNLALASKALTLGFNVRASHAAKLIAEKENLPIYYHTIIYELIDEVKQVMSGLLEPLVKENVLGVLEIKEIFRSSKMGTIAGCYVKEGTIRRGQLIRLLRDNVIVHQGELNSLKRFKEDVNEVRVGTACGIGIKNYTDIQVGDTVEVYEKVTVARTI